MASYNIRHGEGADGLVDLQRIADVISRLGADMVAVQEVDSCCERSGKIDTAAELGRILGMHSRFAPFMAYQGGEYGLAVLSRLPIRETVIHTLPEGIEPRCALEVVVQPQGGSVPLSFVCLHNDPTYENIRVAQIEALIAALQARPHPVILAGDFNAEKSSRSITRIEQAGWHVLDKQGLKTFPADNPTAELDFISVRGVSGRPGRACEVHTEVSASDHRPISAVIDLGP